jgi:hypothetical protein
MVSGAAGYPQQKYSIVWKVVEVHALRYGLSGNLTYATPPHLIAAR